MRAPARMRLLKWIFAFYCIGMLWLLFLQRLGSVAPKGRYNLIPFDTIGLYLRALRYSESLSRRNAAIANLTGNVALFIPLGICLPLLFLKQQRLTAFAFLVVAILLLVELLQYFTGLGALDVDDLILNLTGVLLGRCVWHFIWNRKKQ